MMFLKRTAAAILGGAILCSGAAFAADMTPIAETDTVISTAAPSESAPVVMAERSLYAGKITEVVRDEKTNAVTGLLMESEKDGAYMFHLDAQTMLLNSGEGIRATADQLTVGDSIYVFHSPIATMSLPPQSYAEAVIVNVPADARSAMLHTVEAVQKNEDGSAVVTTDRGNLQLTIAKDAQYGDFNGRQIMGTDDLRIGTRIFAWYDSARDHKAATSKVVVAPAKEQTELPIVVDGKTLEATAKLENGTLMVPASAVSKVFGLTASYEKTPTGEQVTLKSDKSSMVMDIGSDSYLVAEDTILSYGAPSVITEGTTWMPAQALADLVNADLSLATGAAAFTTAK